MVGLIIGGRETAGANSLRVLNPFDGSTVEEAASADASQVAMALEAACQNQGQARKLSRAERAAILERVARGLAASRQELATVLAREVGKTLTEAALEVDRAAATFAAAAEEAKRIAGEVIPFDAVAGGTGRRGFVIRVPVGTVVAITPFNFPLNLAAHKVAPAIAAGNTFILKPASQAPLSALALGRLILEAGFPPGAVSVLPGPGATVGMGLVRDRRPRVVSFTGSPDVGRTIAEAAGLKRTTMELGSNSAVVVAASADIEFAARRIVQGGYAVAGQVCISVQRVVAEEKVFDRLVERVTSLASEVKIGNQLDQATDMGPMISPEAAARLKTWIDEAVAEGAELRLGGTHRGALFTPTVLARVGASTRVWSEEAFGPVICLNPCRDFDEALGMVNQSRFGLQAGVFTASLEQAFEAVERLEVGGVIINDIPTYRVDHMPYGGVKDSGMGREGLKYAIEEMTEARLVCFNFWRP
jgi:glyceraldehyde-3-phosphate dehydrogenase (NADP+)